MLVPMEIRRNYIPLELELGMVRNHRMDSGYWTPVLQKQLILLSAEPSLQPLASRITFEKRLPGLFIL